MHLRGALFEEKRIYSFPSKSINNSYCAAIYDLYPKEKKRRKKNNAKFDWNCFKNDYIFSVCGISAPVDVKKQKFCFSRF